MQQAILIMAHNNVKHIADMVRFFGQGFEIYIHLDRKVHIQEEEILVLKRMDNVKMVSRQFKAYWGGFNLLKIQLLLIEQALKNPDNRYLHLISGQDIPIKNADTFRSFFSSGENREFLGVFALPSAGLHKGGMERLAYYQLYDWFSLKNRTGERLSSAIRAAQKFLGIKRKWPSGIKIYGGSGWWSLSRACAAYIIDYTKDNPAFLNRFRYSFAPDEHYIPTVVMNAEFSDKVTGDNLRYISWAMRHNSAPAILDESDFEWIKTSEKFFARKIQFPESQQLVDMVWNDLQGKKGK